MSAELHLALRTQLGRVLAELDGAQRIVNDALTRVHANDDDESEQHCLDLLDRIYSISDATRFFISELHQ